MAYYDGSVCTIQLYGYNTHTSVDYFLNYHILNKLSKDERCELILRIKQLLSEVEELYENKN